MDHPEIRFRILYILYQKYYSEQLGHLQITDNIIKEAGLDQINKHVVYGDVIYLENKGLIHGEFILGHAHPPWINITSYGIDFVESVVQESIDNNIKPKHHTSTVLDILNETDPVRKIIKTVEFSQGDTSQWMGMINIIKNRFYN